MAAAVEMRGEGDALLVELAPGGQRHDLKSAGIGQYRVWPVHKAVQTAERRNSLRPRPQHQMIGIAEQDPCTRGGDPLGGHRLDRAGAADGHEDRRVDVAMRGSDAPAPRSAVSRQQLKTDHAPYPRLPPPPSRASPVSGQKQEKKSIPPR